MNVQKISFSDIEYLNTIENEMLIMAGGKGKRLRPFTDNTPKPLLPVNGKPIIERIIIAAKKQGIKKFIISINYLGNQIKSYLKNGDKFNVDIRYINEYNIEDFVEVFLNDCKSNGIRVSKQNIKCKFIEFLKPILKVKKINGTR